ncbi:hypothetical protein ACH5RR_001674 [Cinchona calisaya]|uniref:MHD domain-containing protein n=1 Tax=Cinchona calisaya TaxID=153742 RepID=A0ABD3B4V5_9GENT
MPPLMATEVGCINENALSFALELAGMELVGMLSIRGIVADVLSDYLKGLNEDQMMDNFVIVYELLDEMIDNGFPLTREPNILREMIAPPNIVSKVLSIVTGLLLVIGQIPKDKALSVSGKLVLKTGLQRLHLFPSFQVGFSIMGVALSGLEIAKLDLKNLSSCLYKGFRALTKAREYEVRSKLLRSYQFQVGLFALGLTNQEPSVFLKMTKFLNGVQLLRPDHGMSRSKQLQILAINKEVHQSD